MIKNEISVSQVELTTTIQTALNAPLVRSTFKHDKQIGFSFVRVLVVQFLNSFAFATKISDEQINVMTIDFLEKFDYESVYDIVLFLKMARRGDFGAAMHSVDSNLIFGDWFPKYLEFKAEEREKQYIKEKSQQNKQILSTEDIKKAYDKQQNEAEIFRQKVKNYVDRITKDMNRTQLEETIDEWATCPHRQPYLDILKRKRKEIKD